MSRAVRTPHDHQVVFAAARAVQYEPDRPRLVCQLPELIVGEANSSGSPRLSVHFSAGPYSCCHLSRKAFFQRLAGLLRPGDRLFLTGCFLVRAEYEELFDCHWHVRLGTIEEYRNAAREAGLRDESLEEIAERVEQFWALTLALIQAEAQGKKRTPREKAKFKEAVQTHELVRQGLANGGYHYVLMSFSKKRDA